VDADDVASEVFLQVARDLGRFEGDEPSFRSWVFVIAHRRLIDSRRSAQRRPALADENDRNWPGGDVEDEAMKKISQERVYQILAHLTEDQQEVLALRVVADLSLKETAQTMAKSIGAVKALQRRAVVNLKRLFEEGDVTL
jgi:RNA polymerase sigma-70 factor (ECF subfamily)